MSRRDNTPSGQILKQYCRSRPWQAQALDKTDIGIQVNADSICNVERLRSDACLEKKPSRSLILWERYQRRSQFNLKEFRPCRIRKTKFFGFLGAMIIFCNRAVLLYSSNFHMNCPKIQSIQCIFDLPYMVFNIAFNK